MKMDTVWQAKVADSAIENRTSNSFGCGGCTKQLGLGLWGVHSRLDIARLGLAWSTRVKGSQQPIAVFWEFQKCPFFFLSGPWPFGHFLSLSLTHWPRFLLLCTEPVYFFFSSHSFLLCFCFFLFCRWARERPVGKQGRRGSWTEEGPARWSDKLARPGHHGSSSDGEKLKAAQPGHHGSSSRKATAAAGRAGTAWGSRRGIYEHGAAETSTSSYGVARQSRALRRWLLNGVGAGELMGAERNCLGGFD